MLGWLIHRTSSLHLPKTPRNEVDNSEDPHLFVK